MALSIWSYNAASIEHQSQRLLVCRSQKENSGGHGLRQRELSNDVMTKKRSLTLVLDKRLPDLENNKNIISCAYSHKATVPL